MDAKRDGLAVGLFAHDTLNVHHVFETVDRYHFAFPTFIRTTLDKYLVVFADRDRSDLTGSVSVENPGNRSWNF